MWAFVGVPGCGKSTLIAKEMSYKTLTVCLTRSPVEEIKKMC